MKTRVTDAEVIGASEEDSERFSVIYDRHFADINRYLRRRLPGVEADDLTAEVFATAFAERARYDSDRGDARPWLFGIAANLLRRHYRSERRQLRAYARTGADPLIEGGFEAADSRVDAASTSAVLARALSGMPDREREALLLFAWAELSYEQIAATLAVPVGTVASRLSRARARLRKELAPRESPGPNEGPKDERRTDASG